ncbi:hypothetical protein BpHYR1_008940 [Brachionus plicatilis]|uniref:Uncharacterized protein n=1 Tax=Brachionus plicatilis TaxID=10195 RepID=A0A3M7QJY3_BRAPC|nr:hypothetical protein BpHYR1_008940 [Brachionus plicatilis]
MIQILKRKHFFILSILRNLEKPIFNECKKWRYVTSKLVTQRFNKFSKLKINLILRDSEVNRMKKETKNPMKFKLTGN